MRSFWHNIAASLYRAAEYNLAIPLLRRVVEYGTLSPWPYLWLAASLWATTKDAAAVLPLLEQAAHRYPGDSMWDECRKLPEFGDIVDGPEFRNAVRRPSV